MEGGGEFAQPQPAVALGIDRDEERLDLARLIAQIIHHLRNLRQCRRADIGAVGEAEEHERVLARKIRRTAQSAFCIGECEVRSKGGLGKWRGRGLCNKQKRPISQQRKSRRRPEDFLQPRQSHPTCHSLCAPLLKPPVA